MHPTRGESDVRAAITEAAKQAGVYSDDSDEWEVHCTGYDGNVDTVQLTFGDMNATGGVAEILEAIRESNSLASLHDACERRGLLTPG
jgi:hypothetical protein